MVNGLSTIALSQKPIKCYRLTTTRRLTPTAATLSGIFYSNRLTSLQKNPVIFEGMKNPQYFPNEGGTIIYTTSTAHDAICSNEALFVMHQVVDDILGKYPERSIAIISPFRDSVKRIQKEFNVEREERDITVDTVDRIQGITVDYTILYFPQRNISFVLNQNRFNVATSRSSSTTLIVSDLPLVGFRTISKKISQYLSKCRNLSNEGELSASDDIEPDQTLKGNDSNTVVGVKIIGKIDLSQFERPKKELSKTKRNYYIIDTNVFVNYPDILSKIDVKYPIILSAKVVDELDKMKIKLSEQEKRNAEKALRLLNQDTKHQIIYQSADVSLLPDDFDKRSPDNMILSVALKFKDENPIMLTSDNGLQLKCKSQGIATVSLRDFLKR